MAARLLLRLVALLFAFGSLAAGPAYANDRCLRNGICWTSERLDSRKINELHISLKGGNRIGVYVPYHYNVRIGGRDQFRVNVSSSFRSFTVSSGTQISVQACRKLTTRSICSEWSAFKPY